MQDLGEPIEVLSHDRLVEAELVMDDLYLLQGRALADQEGGGIAGDELDQEERQRRDDEERRDGE